MLIRIKAIVFPQMLTKSKARQGSRLAAYAACYKQRTNYSSVIESALSELNAHIKKRVDVYNNVAEGATIANGVLSKLTAKHVRVISLIV